MISYLTIKKAKAGNNEAISEILNFYTTKIQKISSDEEFAQIALIRVFKCINNFKNKK